MALDLNVSPYYNDFDATKQFEKVLFKPGVAVQARELTQLQSYLSNAIKNHADFTLTEGTRVSGGEGTVLFKPYIKINDIDSASATVVDSTLINYVGDTITGSSTGITATILSTQTGADSDNVNKKTLYLGYTGGNPTGAGSQGNAIHFDAGETLTVTSTDSGRNGDTFVVDSTRSTTDVALNYYGIGLFFVIADGVFFLKNQFVTHLRQEILLEKYNPVASYFVGLQVKETIITSDTDTSLLDPSSGSFNFNAPGADRYKVSTILTKKTLTEDSDEDFVAVDKVIDGKYYQKVTEDVGQLNEIGKILAGRTYEESGNYVTAPFSIVIDEHLQTSNNRGKFLSSNTARPGNSQKLALSVGSGTAYVNGFRHNFQSPQIVDVDKATTTQITEGQTVSTGYGNYFFVNEFAGTWNIKDGTLVTLYNTAKTAVTSGTYGSTSAPASSNIIGQARIKQIEYSSGTLGLAATVYRMYLYDISITKGKLADARGLYYSNSTDSGFADCVLESSKAVIKETIQNKLIFRTPYSSAKTLAAASGGSYDTQYYYQEEFDVTFAADGTATISATGSSQFPYSGSITQTIIDRNFILVATSGSTINGTATTAGRVIPLTPSMITSASTGSMVFDLGTVSGSSTAKMFVKVVNVDSAPVPKNLISNVYVKINTATNEGGAIGPWNLGISDIFTITNVYVDGDGYVETGENQRSKFILDKGQKDNVYGHGKLKKNTNSPINTTSKYIVVKLKCFTPNYAATGGTYFAVNSYPTDDTGSAGIYTYEIPRYDSKQSGSYNLRDCIDFRPMITNTAVTATANLAAATINPSKSNTINAPTDGVQHPAPTQNFTTDVEFYLRRIDKVVITDQSEFKVFKGIPSVNPRSPIVPENQGMPLVELNIPAYPSVSPFVGDAFGVPGYTVGKRLLQNRRYTMSDINRIEKRINRLEYYTALSLMEQESQNMNIVDANGNTRFKNGIFINVFTTHALSDVADPSFKCAIDPILKRVGPAYKETRADLVFNSTTSSGVTRSGDLLTLPFTKTVFSENRFSSKARNCVGELLFAWEGDLNVYPRGANYVDTTRLDDYHVEDNSLSEFGNQLANDISKAQIISSYDIDFASVPNEPTSQSWGAATSASDEFTTTTSFGASDEAGSSGADAVNGRGVRGVAGVQVDTSATVDITGTVTTTGRVDSSSSISGSIIQNTSTTTATATKQMLTAQAAPHDTQKVAMGEKLVSAELNLYMKAMPLMYIGTRFKPNTKLYGFFDGEAQTAVKFQPVLASNVNNLIALKNQHSRPSDLLAAAGAAGYLLPRGTQLTTDANGIICGFYYMPGGTFMVGERQLRFTDDVKDRASFVTTSAQAPFSSSGISTASQQTVVSTAIPKIVFGQTAPVSENVGSWTQVTSVEMGAVNMSSSVTATAKSTVDLNVDLETETHVQVTGGFDPIAQTFFVEDPEGVMATEVKVFFRKKSSTASITLQLREVVNGYPSRSVLPYGEVNLAPSQVTVTTEDADGTIRFSPEGQPASPYTTTFGFEAPVQLKGNTEYCFVLLPAGNSPDYEVWCSELGQNKVGVGVQNQRIFAEDTNIGGILFTSSNNRTWNAHQAEDMTYQITKAVYASSNGTVHLENGNTDYIIGESYSGGRPAVGTLVHGWKATLSSGGSGHAVNDVITLANATDSSGNALTGVKVKVTTISGGAITAFAISDPGTLADNWSGNPGALNQLSTSGTGTGATVSLTLARGRVTNSNPITEQIDIDVITGHFRNQTDGALITPLGNGATFFTNTSIEDRKFNQVRTTMNLIENDGVMTYEYAPTKSANVSSVGTTYEVLGLNVRKNTADEKSIRSYSNEDYYLSGADTKTLHFKITLPAGTNTNLSPVLDLSALGLLTIQNLLNNDSTNETTNDGNALSRYINKPVVLADGMEAQDVVLQVALLQPPGASIEVYGKFQAEADDADFNEDLPWIKLARDDDWSPIGNSVTQSAFVDFGFKIPDANKTAGVFTYSTDRVTEISIDTAGSGYTSAPELFFSAGEATAFALLSGNTVGSLTLTAPGRDYGSTPTIVVGTQHAVSTQFATGQQVANGANLYTVTTGGTTAASGSAPTHTSSSQTDGTVVFAYAGAAALVSCTVNTVTFEEFKKFSTKFVFLSANTSKVPYAKDLRIVATT